MIETLVQRAVQTDCPSKGLCDQLIIESAILEDADRHYDLVRVPMLFEALADIISYQLVECDILSPSCSVIDRYKGEFGVVEVVTDTGQPHLHWEPFSP